MYIKNITVYISVYVILSFQYINSYNVTINSEYIPEDYIYEYEENRYISKSRLGNDVIDYERNYYCKNNICYEMYNSLFPFFIEFPENNTIKRYIINSCIYNERLNEVTDCRNYKKVYNSNETTYIDFIDYSCTSDSECFYNKCINNYCVFNKDPSSTHCDFVHTGFAMFQSTDIRCGKTYKDECTSSYECSSYYCSDNKCILNYYIPSESTYISTTIESFIFYVIIIFIYIFIICCCIYFCILKNKRNRKQEQQFNKLNTNTK